MNAAVDEAIGRRDFDRALQLLRELIQAEPGNVAALNLLAAVQAEVGQAANAAATYALSLGRDANQPETLANLAMVLYRLGQD